MQKNKYAFIHRGLRCGKNTMNKEKMEFMLRGISSGATPQLPLRQHFYAWICRKLAGDEHEENVTFFRRVKGIRLIAYNFFDHLRMELGAEISLKHKTHTFEEHRLIKWWKKHHDKCEI